MVLGSKYNNVHNEIFGDFSLGFLRINTDQLIVISPPRPVDSNHGFERFVKRAINPHIRSILVVTVSN